MKTERYGRYYWGVNLATGGEIYLTADDVVVSENGALSFLRDGDKNRVNLILAPGAWLSVFAASLMSGHPVAVEHWEE